MYYMYNHKKKQIYVAELLADNSITRFKVMHTKLLNNRRGW